MGLKLTQVDAFTNRVFRGNPAAVCILPEPQSDEWMQLLARELNLSETAFLLKEGEGFRLRWFSPRREVRLCGHATLASAHVLWEQGILKSSQEAIFQTLSGRLFAKHSDGWIELDFPLIAAEPQTAPDALVASLKNIPMKFTGISKHAWLVELENEEAVRSLSPEIGAMRNLDRDVLVTAAASDSNEYDFVSRYFAPLHGIDEDPVTGSAHCVLAPYWAAKCGKTELGAYQASARGGFLRVRVANDRVNLIGQAVTVLHSELV